MTIALSPQDFQPKLGDVIRQVFGDEAKALSTRLSEHILTEFFTIYDTMLTDHAFLEEYRDRSNIIGHRVRVLVGHKYARGRVAGIDDHALLLVRLNDGRELTVSSRSEVVF
jgi:biotin-(acetyl-CoA carboxylase) ligase